MTKSVRFFPPPLLKMALTRVVSALSSSTGSTGMSLAKTTVDKLLKGYDIRLRPDFGGTCWVTSVLGSHALLSRVFTSQGVHKMISTSHSSEICQRVGLWHIYIYIYIGNGFQVTATMSLLCIYSHIEDGCSYRSREHMVKSSQTLCSLRPEIVNVLIFNTFLIRDVSWPLCIT